MLTPDSVYDYDLATGEMALLKRTPVLDAACHAVLVLAAVITCAPLYYAVVAGSLTAADRPNGESIGPNRSTPPRSVARATAASQSSTAKYTLT